MEEDVFLRLCIIFLFVLCLGIFADDAWLLCLVEYHLGLWRFVRLLTSMILYVNSCGLVCCFKCYWISVAKF